MKTPPDLCGSKLSSKGIPWRCGHLERWPKWAAWIFPAGVLLPLLALLIPSSAFSKPRPPLPPWPELVPLLSRFSFDGPYSQSTKDAALIDTEDGQLIESWSGYALIRSGSMLKPFVVPAVENGRTNLATAAAAVRLWFKPYWSSSSLPNGTGPGADATLVEMIVLGKNEVLSAWSLRFDANGTALVLLGEGDGGTTELLRVDVAWPANEWHCVALNYGPKETALFLDGQLVAKGAGVVSVPASAAGLTWGSTAYGTGAAEGEMDELCAFARPLREFDTAFYALAYSTMAARGPITAEEEAASKEAAAKRRAEQEAMMEMMRAQQLTNSTVCPTNVPLFLTNITCALATNGIATVTFDMLGGTNGVLYDIFSTTNLIGSNITNSTWQWEGQGYTCNTYQLTNQTSFSTFYVLGIPLDSDGDGLTDAYERLVSKTDPNTPDNPDTDGDGISDYLEFLLGGNPSVAAGSDTNGLIRLQVYSPLR